MAALPNAGAPPPIIAANPGLGLAAETGTHIT
jgi:hypothetical protein